MCSFYLFLVRTVSLLAIFFISLARYFYQIQKICRTFFQNDCFQFYSIEVLVCIVLVCNCNLDFIFLHAWNTKFYGYTRITNLKKQMCSSNDLKFIPSVLFGMGKKSICNQLITKFVLITKSILSIGGFSH